MVSEIVNLGHIFMPKYASRQVYMQPFSLDESNHLLDGFIAKMVSFVPHIKGEAYLTVDEKLVKDGRSHRRGGAHVDGNYISGWGSSSGWLTGVAGRKLPESDHAKHYCAEAGGTLIISDINGCRGWTGNYSGKPTQGGNCEHIDLSEMDTILMEPNYLYWMNSTAIHESIPIEGHRMRSLIRITLPPTANLKNC